MVITVLRVYPDESELILLFASKGWSNAIFTISVSETLPKMSNKNPIGHFKLFQETILIHIIMNFYGENGDWDRRNDSWFISR